MLQAPKTILLTGGTSGIGLALLKQLHAQGHKLIVVARNGHALQQLKDEYAGLTIYECDLSSRFQVESLADFILREHAGVEIVFNNAGVQYTSMFIDDGFEFDSIEQETTLNFLAPVWITALLLPMLLEAKQASAIVNISSGLAYAPKTQSAVYCATKAAIHSVSQSLRYQLENTPVTVFEAIMPLVDTPMTAGRGRGKISPEDAARQIIEGINKNRPEIFVGKTKILPFLMRLSPGLVRNIMKKF